MNQAPAQVAFSSVAIPTIPPRLQRFPRVPILSPPRPTDRAVTILLGVAESLISEVLLSFRVDLHHVNAGVLMCVALAPAEGLLYYTETSKRD